jgi:hypothetical protein
MTLVMDTAIVLSACVASVLAPLAAQPSGRIAGRVVEARTGAPLVAVLVEVQSTRQRGWSDADGQFAIADVPAGPQTLVVSVVGFGLVRRDVTVSPSAVTDVTIPVAGGASTYVENVTVSGGPFRDAEPAAPSQAVLGSRELLALRGVLADDPFRAVQTLPGVATSDDFRGEFSLRALGPEHIGIAVDGVDSPFLFHTVRAVNDTGSLALINSDILQEAVLLAGPHPQRLGSHLGARVDFMTRDGARSGFAARLMVGGSAATALAEGPIGSGLRGSWLLAARRSYIDWLLERIDPDIDGRFGFTDVQGGVTYDLSARQQVRLTFIGGRSLLHDRDATLSLNALQRGSSQTAIANARWRFTVSPAAIVNQQLYVVRNSYANKVADGRVREQGWDRDVTWRGSVDWRPDDAHALEVGGQVQSLGARRRDHRLSSPTTMVTTLDERLATGSAAAYVAYRWAPSARLVISPGTRIERFALLQKTVAAPWSIAEWLVLANTRIRVGAGLQQQSPTPDDALFARAGDRLVPERSLAVEIGAEQRLGRTWRASLTVYRRTDRDRLRFEDAEFRVVDGALVRPGASYIDNVLSGVAHGIDAVVERRSVNGWTGWVSYAYGHATVTDENDNGDRGGAGSGRERYPADYDQRHTANIYSAYRWSGHTSVSARFRYGSNFPVPAYVIPQGGAWVLSSVRNRARLPAYARLDLRADRAFTLGKRRLTVFAEVINLLDRDNYRGQTGTLNVTTWRVTGVTERVFPLLPSGGILVEF